MPTPDAAADPTEPRLLYVMGTGRSGSTVLEILLAQEPQAFGAGELTKLLDDGFIQNKTCSCGAPFADCPVWAPIRRRLLESTGEAASLANDFRQTDRHAGFWRQLARGREPTARYVDFNREILSAIHATTGANVVVDSSKYAGRALALDRIVGPALRVIWLTRDPAAILASFQTPNQTEQRPKSLAMAALYVAFVTLCCGLAQRRLAGRCIVVRYEDLMARPAQELLRIAGWAGVSLEEAVARVNAAATLPVGHLITANRLRKSGHISLRKPEAGTGAGRPGRRIVASALRAWYRALGLA